jgi:hypothetical protein
MTLETNAEKAVLTYQRNAMDYTKLLANFNKPKAKIDFIKLRLPASIRSIADAARLTENIDGRINAPDRWRDVREDHFTIHDPAHADLQFLIDEHHEAEILALEVAVDFKLKDKSNDPAHLAELHAWLKTHLFPQRHVSMSRNGRRKYYDEVDGAIKRDALKTRSTDKSVYWANKSGYEQVRLYIKIKDNEQPIDPHCVRIEATLDRGGCQLAGVHRVGLLPIFADNMRRYLSPFFNVAAGIKPKIKRTRSKDPARVLDAVKAADRERAKAERNWGQYGSAWAAKHGYRIVPDTETNGLIGLALKDLRDDLMGLTAPRKVADWPVWVEEQFLMYQRFGEPVARPYRSKRPKLTKSYLISEKTVRDDTCKDFDHIGATDSAVLPICVS